VTEQRVKAIPEGMHNVTPHLVVRDAARAAKWYAEALGAEVLHPLGDTFWGDRHGQITDPFGHRWGLAQHIRDVPTEEIARAAAKAFGD
jgi:uncharacterized glyoxalase superfamily protein PhnB